MPETVSAGRLQQANALMGLSRESVGVIGPAVAGALVATVGPGWVFAVDSATFAVSAWSVALLRLGRLVAAAERKVSSPSCAAAGGS